MTEHTIQDTHKKTCIDCGRTWNCRGCIHKSPSGFCSDCRELQSIIIQMESNRIDGKPLF